MLEFSLSRNKIISGCLHRLSIRATGGSRREVFHKSFANIYWHWHLIVDAFDRWRISFQTNLVLAVYVKNPLLRNVGRSELLFLTMRTLVEWKEMWQLHKWVANSVFEVWERYDGKCIITSYVKDWFLFHVL